MGYFSKYFKSFFYNLFVKLFKKGINKSKIDPHECNNILIIQIGDLQEALTITPLLKVLKKTTSGKITVLGTHDNSIVFNDNPDIDKFTNCAEGFNFIKQIFFQLRNIGFNLIINSHENGRRKVSYILGAVKSKYKLGFNNIEDNLLSHRVLQLNKAKYHSIDRILNLMDPFNISVDKSELNYFYIPTRISKNKIEDYFVKNDLTYKLTVLLNISNKSEFGFWGIVNYQKLIKYIKNYDVNIIIAASIEDIEVAESISSNNHLIYYNNDFDIYAELVKNSDFIISPEAFTIQLASAFKIPVFCLFTQKESPEMINVPYNSDFDFAISDKQKLESLSFGNVLNSFIPYLDYIYKQYRDNNKG